MGPLISLFIPTAKPHSSIHTTYFPIQCPTLHLSRVTPIFDTMPSYSIFFFMAPLLYLILSLMIASISAQGPPSPGYSPSSKINSITFDQGFRNRWGPQHQKVDQDTLTIWLDNSSGLIISPQLLSHLFFMQPLMLLYCLIDFVFSFIVSTISSLTCSLLNIGSGFKSLQTYRSGYFGAAIKLQSGYTAGVITSLYVSITLNYIIYISLA